MDETTRTELKVCSAILTKNRRELEWAVSLSASVVKPDLLKEAREALKTAPVPGESALVKATTYLPAWIQYVGQRAILLFPRMAKRLLRSSGLHHQMY